LRGKMTTIRKPRLRLIAAIVALIGINGVAGVSNLTGQGEKPGGGDPEYNHCEWICTGVGSPAQACGDNLGDCAQEPCYGSSGSACG
jgi:hypothetical protein